MREFNIYAIVEQLNAGILVEDVVDFQVWNFEVAAWVRPLWKLVFMIGLWPINFIALYAYMINFLGGELCSFLDLDILHALFG